LSGGNKSVWGGDSSMRIADYGAESCLYRQRDLPLRDRRRSRSAAERDRLPDPGPQRSNRARPVQESPAA